MSVRSEVIWFNCDKGWGFARLGNGDGDIFIHRRHIINCPFALRKLKAGEIIEFEVGEHNGRPVGINIRKTTEAATVAAKELEVASVERE